MSNEKMIEITNNVNISKNARNFIKELNQLMEGKTLEEQKRILIETRKFIKGRNNKRKTRRKLKGWVKHSLIGIVSMIIIFGLLNMNGKMEQDFVSNCESQGYSHNYCVTHS